MALNVLTVNFSDGSTKMRSTPLYQYDYGQILQITGVDLPESYEVHFSNHEMAGTTIKQIGNTNGVTIPDELLLTGKTVYAYIYLHETNDDGATEYCVIIPVFQRPEPTDATPTPVEQSQFTEAIAALNAALTTIDTKVDKSDIDSALSDTSANPVQNKAIYSKLATMEETENDLNNRVKAIEEATSIARYGVSGIGQSASALTRLYDAVGAVAQVGTDGDNSNVRNDFDSFAPWKWRKCVGVWTNEDGRAVFHVAAYYGDDDYAEDGSMGDYVAVECPISYYKMEGNTLVISAHRYEEYRPFDIFCHDHNPQDTIPYYYRPAYALALKDGHAVSLPGYDNEAGNYYTLVNAARTYGDGSMGNLPILYPMALSFYDWAMFTVEFAVQNQQSIMYGCTGLRHNADDRLTFIDATHVLVQNWQAARVAGEYIAITPTNVDINTWNILATHRIVTVTRCTSDGTASSSGTYTLLEVEDLGKTYYEYDATGGTEYRIAARPYRTGATNSVSTPSGSPVSNTNGYYPMKYRWVENLYGNQYKTTMDFFNGKMGTGDDDYYLEHYYLKRPQEYVPTSASKPDATDLATDLFAKLDITTEHANYVNGYVKSKKYSKDYPNIWIPYETTGASGSTYFADYAYLVLSTAVRSVRLFGFFYSGAYAGLSFFAGHYAPSTAYAHYGGVLYIHFSMQSKANKTALLSHITIPSYDGHPPFLGSFELKYSIY